jgi:hypothetical protein
MEGRLMPLNLVEIPESRRQTKNVTTNRLQSCDLAYKVWEELDDATVRAYLDQELPRKYENLSLDTYDLDPEDEHVGLWRVSAHYKLPEEASEGTPGGQAIQFQFSTTGGTQTLKQSFATVDSFVCPANQNAVAENFKGAINVADDGPQGTEIIVPKLEFGWTYTVITAAIDVYTIYELTGKVNSVNYKGFPAGSLLFLGCEGTAEIGSTGRLTYKFAASQNKTGLTTNGSRQYSKKGWEYVWFVYGKRGDAAANKVVTPPVSGYVERVYETADFSLLGLP